MSTFGFEVTFNLEQRKNMAQKTLCLLLRTPIYALSVIAFWIFFFLALFIHFVKKKVCFNKLLAVSRFFLGNIQWFTLRDKCRVSNPGDLHVFCLTTLIFRPLGTRQRLCSGGSLQTQFVLGGL